VAKRQRGKWRFNAVSVEAIMSNDIKQILGELRQDHRNMTLLLNMIEQESNHLYDGGDSDFEVIRDVMHYMTVYPDAVHHPKEDRLYAELKAVRPDLSAGFDRITLDHRAISESGLRLRDELDSIGAGSFVRRKSLVADALRYVNSLRSHMQWEELDLFRRCEEMAATGHVMIIDSNLVSAGDPVFGEKHDSEFKRLLKSVEQSLTASRA
jgi:hemerythrin-like domain-containing protein